MELKAARVRMRTPSPGNHRAAGFTLLELIIVLILLALVTAVVGISLSGGMSGLQLETSTRDVITLMKHARSEAVGKQQVVRVVFGQEQGAGQYVMTNDFGEPIKLFSLPTGFVFEAPEGRELPMVVSFYANGRSSGGLVAVKSPSGRRYFIEADPITGFARMARLQEENR